MATTWSHYREIWAEIPTGGLQRTLNLNDLMSADNIADALGCDGALHLHLTDKRSPMKYLVAFQALVFLTQIRNGILQTNKTTWASTDTRLGPNVFFKENPTGKLRPLS